MRAAPGFSSISHVPPTGVSLTTLKTLALAALVTIGFGCGPRADASDARMVRSLDDDLSGVVAVASSVDEQGKTISLCSGALVAPNLVLTARHCVSRAVTNTPACDTRGNSRNGVHLAEDVDPGSIMIFQGAHVSPGSDEPIARAVRTLRPTGQVLCDADVAFLVLDRAIPNAVVLPMRLYGAVKKGDLVVPIGFGGGVANSVGRRVARASSDVLAIGPSANVDTGAVLGPREFEVAEATCRGDSGGPAIDAHTGEIVGVVSRGGSCTHAGNHVYTRIDAYSRLATMALVAAGRQPYENVAERERE